ncbi:MAG TPA: hypothetical protein VKR31_11135 [Rhizomicrobium sp.]|nr:hypothetical protein [Rhizomicrobium sp.]
MSDSWSTLAGNFGGFDGITYAIMAIIVVGAAFMMPTMSAIVTATCAALFIFGFSAFLRSVLSAQDARTVARDDWNYALTLPLHTVLVYAGAFCFLIAIVHSLRNFAKQQ